MAVSRDRLVTVATAWLNQVSYRARLELERKRLTDCSYWGLDQAGLLSRKDPDGRGFFPEVDDGGGDALWFLIYGKGLLPVVGIFYSLLTHF